MIRDKKKLAIIAILLPYAVDLVAILSLRSFIGIEGYRSNPQAWDMYGTAIIVAVKIAIVMAWLLTIPFYVDQLHQKHDKWHSQLVKRVFTVIAYFGANTANTVLVVVFHAIVWTKSGGVI